MHSKKAIVTGITGQFGSYLTEYLLEQNYEVHGIIRRSSTFNTSRIAHLYKDPHDHPHMFLHYGDVTDGARISELVHTIQPELIFHLAAQSHVRVSFDEPVYTMQTIATGTLNILEAIRNYAPNAKFYHAASSEMFGKVQEIPQTEKTPFYPRSPYGCSKLYAYWQTVNYRESYNIFACNGILFNNESPRRGETFVTRKITRAAARIKEGMQKELYLGNLDAKRDWGYTKDYVQAVYMMLQHYMPDDYVIATGETHSVREFLDIVFNHLNLDPDHYVKIDPKYLRPSEVDILVGDASKARRVLGWKPTVSFKELAIMMTEKDWELAKKEKYTLKD